MELDGGFQVGEEAWWVSGEAPGIVYGNVRLHGSNLPHASVVLTCSRVVLRPPHRNAKLQGQPPPQGG